MVKKRVDLSPGQIEHLKSLVTGLVSTNETVLDQHGRDESAIPPVRPSAVVMPQSTEEVSKVLAYCNTEKIPVVAFGAGSSLEGHVLPLFGGISLDLTEMNKIVEIRPDDLLVRVQPGVHRVALNEKISSSGLFFSVDPGADATLGGMAATGAAGTTTVRYGSMRDNVLALTAVMADGTVIQTGRETRKLSAGYDLTRLLVGSEGTLAVITELTLRVFGIPEKMAAAIVRFETLSDGVTAASGGTGGGGNGQAKETSAATAGAVNTGSGGGGGGSPTYFSGDSGAGGKGVVILRIPTANYSGTTTGSPTVTTDGSDKVIVFNASGSITG